MPLCVFIPTVSALDEHVKQLFETEAKRNIKKDPPLATEFRKSIFPLASEEGAEAGVRNDVVNELWTF
jgi:U3 small nucleolar RNA-associated protein 19